LFSVYELIIVHYDSGSRYVWHKNTENTLQREDKKTTLSIDKTEKKHNTQPTLRN